MRLSRKEFTEAVAEEISMWLGLDTRVDGDEILVDTMAGPMTYDPVGDNVMEAVYRFVMRYGQKLHSYGLRKSKEVGFLKKP